MKNTTNNCDQSFQGFCNSSSSSCTDQILKYTDGKLVVTQNNKQLFCQEFFLNENITEYSTKQVILNPGEQKNLINGDSSEFIFIWVSWLTTEIEFPLFLKNSGYDNENNSIDFLNSNWTPVYNFHSITSIPSYRINDILIKNIHTQEDKIAKILIFNAKT